MQQTQLLLEILSNNISDWLDTITSLDEFVIFNNFRTTESAPGAGDEWLATGFSTLAELEANTHLLQD